MINGGGELYGNPSKWCVPSYGEQRRLSSLLTSTICVVLSFPGRACKFTRMLRDIQELARAYKESSSSCHLQSKEDRSSHNMNLSTVDIAAVCRSKICNRKCGDNGCC